MSRLLQRPALQHAPRVLAGADVALDPFMQSVLAEAQAAAEQAQAQAYERGVRDGYAAGMTAAAEQRQRLDASVLQALAEAKGEVAALRAAQADAVVDLAIAIAEQVVGSEPHSGGKVLADRVRAAIAAIDDTPLTVFVSALDAPLLSELLAGEHGVTVQPDGQLAPGEARVVGRWAEAELLHSTAWAAVKEVLGVDA